MYLIKKIEDMRVSAQELCDLGKSCGGNVSRWIKENGSSLEANNLRRGYKGTIKDPV